MKRTLIAVAAAVVFAAGFGVAAAQGQPADYMAETVERASFAPTAEKVVPEAAPEVAPTVEPVAPVQAPAPVTAQCPSGTTAGAVDAAGNESNCQATNNGQPCAEYNAANQCTAWYKP